MQSYRLYIDFIRYDKKVVFDRQVRQGPQALLAVDGTGRIVGRADDNGLCGGTDRRFDGPQVQLTGVPLQVTENRLCPGQPDNFRIADITGLWDDDFIPGSRDSHQGQVKGLLGANKDQNLLRRILYMVIFFQFLRDGFPQLVDAHSGRIMGKILFDGPDPGFLDMLRSRKIGLSYVKGNDLPSLPAQGGDSGHHGGSSGHGYIPHHW